MIRTFVNRQMELHFLQEKYQQKGFQFMVLYGRRRVGKTELIKQLLRDKASLYFLADKRGTLSNLERFKEKVAEILQEPKVQVESFDALFHYLAGKIGTKRLIIAIDEFSYLLEKDDALASVFQLSIDEFLQNTNFYLILLGSSVSLMEEGVLSKKSPLYGRRTGQWKLSPLRFAEAAQFWPAYSSSQAVEMYAVMGGIPFYLAKVDDQQSVLDNIEQLILRKGEVLYEEVDFLLREELREPSTYKSILEALAAGCSKSVEIANRTKIKIQDLDKYLKVLRSLGYVQRLVPVTERPSSKKSIYRLSDNFFRFWFTFCFPALSELELGELTKVKAALQANFPAFVGKAFEEVCRQFLEQKKLIEFQKMGNWWGHRREGEKRVEVEIDLVALNEQRKEILLGECKWQEEVDAAALLSHLKEKSRWVEWNSGRRTEYYALFARSFKNKNIKEKNLFLFDLGDIEKAVKR